jgi:hypothetical protein
MKKLALAALAALALSGFTYKASHNVNKTISNPNVANPYNWDMFLPGFQSGTRYIVPVDQFYCGTAGVVVCESTTGQYKLRYQTDGNLVLYKVPGTAIWSSLTVVTGALKVVFAGDGNVYSVRNGTSTYWQSNTFISPVPQGPGPLGFYWALQDDGNLVRYFGSPGSPDLTKPSISTNTAGGVNSPNYGTFQ